MTWHDAKSLAGESLSATRPPPGQSLSSLRYQNIIEGGRKDIQKSCGKGDGKGEAGEGAASIQIARDASRRAIGFHQKGHVELVEVCHPRAHEAGEDGGDRDPFAPQFNTKTLHQNVQGPLAGIIGAGARHASESSQRTHNGDMSLTTMEHIREKESDHSEGGQVVKGGHQLGLGKVHVVDPEGTSASCVQDGEIDDTKPGSRLLDHPAWGVGLCQIGGKDQGVSSPFGDKGRDLVKKSCPAGNQHNARAPLGVNQGKSAAYTA